MLGNQLKPHCLGVGVVIVRGTEVQVGKRCQGSRALHSGAEGAKDLLQTHLWVRVKKGSTRTQRPARFLTV